MKKRLLAVFLTAVMLLGIIPFAAVSAEGKDQFVVQIESKTVYEGDETVSLEVTVPVNKGVWGVRVYLCYDKDLTVGSVDNVTCGDMFPGTPSASFVDALDRDSVEFAESYEKFANLMAASGRENTGYNVTCLAFDGDSDTSVVTAEDGTLLATVQFAINGDADSYEVFGLVDPVDIFKYENGDFVEYDVEVQSGIITVEEKPEEPPVPVDEPTLTVSDAEVNAGEVAEFTLTLTNNPGRIYSICGYIGYDKPMSVVSFEDGEELDNRFGLTMNPIEEENAPTMLDIDLDDIPEDYRHTANLKKYYDAAGLTTENKRATYFLAESGNLSKGTNNDGVVVKFGLDTTGLTAGEYPITFVLDPKQSYDVDYGDLSFVFVHGTLTISEHEHVWEKTGEKAATCTQEGYVEYTCQTGGETRRDVEKALGHDLELVGTVPATCTKTGTETWECSRNCGEEGWQEVKTLAAKGHGEFKTEVVEPDCFNEGYTKYTCTVCNGTEDGGYYEDDFVDKLEHQWEQTEVTGSCGEYGTVHYVCKLCKTEKTEEGAYIDHNWVEHTEDRVEPTCTVDGTAVYECSRCGEWDFVTLDATGHDFDTEVIKPTCTEGGYTIYTCKKCNGNERGGKYEADFVDALGHDMQLVNTVPATCTADGAEYYECSRCDEKETKTLTALGHDYIVTVTPPTCTEQGYTTHTCSRGDSTYVDSYVDALGHDYIVTVTPPTCTEKGYTTHTCSRGDSTYTDTYVDELGHDYVETVVEPTCTEEGYTEHRCSRCDDVYKTDIVDALGHDYENGEVEVVDPTCEEQGYTAHKCARCDGEYRDEYVDALGHIWDNGVITKAPTTEAEGEKTYTCERCGETKTEVVPKLEATDTDVDNGDDTGDGNGNENGNGNAQTGDAAMIITFVGLVALISLAAVVIARKRLLVK